VDRQLCAEIPRHRPARLFWPLLKQVHGNIVNIVGGAAHTPGPDFLIGGAVNAAMANFAKGLTALGNRDDININVIHSGQTQTGRVEQLFQQFAKAQNKTVDQVRAESLSKSGLRRIGQPQDIAALTVFLCGAQARHIHGTAIAVDGGGTPGYYKAMIRFTISIARRSRVSEASGVRNAAWADNVTFSSCASG
jgi:NAD(P)-dependent dehydrogenase (short-subunit alcohol dehydrogenase family)